MDKFKVWDNDEKRFLGKPVLIDQDGDVFGLAYSSQIVHYDGDFKIVHSTGLLDKNGTEIYEGDILYVEQIEVIDPYIPHKKNVAVKYDERNTAFAFDEENGFVIGLYSMPRELEVIGNIYENPELLEEV